MTLLANLLDEVQHRQPNLSEKLACALLMLTDANNKPLIDREWAKGQEPKAIIALFEFDHAIHRAIGGNNHPTNLTPRIKAEHRLKTAKKDIPALAKVKRIIKARANDAAVNALLSKPAKPKLKATFRNHLKRRMDGTVVPREKARP